ncbi:MAG: GntR family transcriptional regulator, partial [Treponema sp.]|nr:GntR family transcriptional regulator [Treponema sp.]
LDKINNSSVVQQVIDSLTKAMIEKKLRPGDKIPTEMELSKSLGVGRLSIREAIKVLVYFGVLEIRRPEGTFVRNGFSESIIDPMLYGIILGAGESLAGLKELRNIAESGVIKLAMRRCTEEDRRVLTEKYSNLEKAILEKPANVQAVFNADNEFHQAIFETGRNHLMTKINFLVRQLTYDIRWRTNANMLERGEEKLFLAAHKTLCEIIFNKDTTNLEEIVEQGYFYDRVNI